MEPRLRKRPLEGGLIQGIRATAPQAYLCGYVEDVGVRITPEKVAIMGPTQRLMRAPASSTDKIHPTTLPGWIS